MPKYIYRTIILFFLLGNHIIYAQKNNVETLFKYAEELSDTGNEAKACVLYKQLEANYTELSIKQQEELWVSWAYALIAQSKNDSATIISNRIVAYAKVSPQNLYSHYDQMGHIYKVKGDLDNSTSYFKKSEEINHIHQLKNVAHLIGFAQVYINKGDYANALKHLFEGYKISIKHKNYVDVVKTMVEIGMVYLYTGKYREAISEYQKAITIQEQHRIDKYLLVCYHRIGIAYSGLQRFKEAIFYYKRAAKGYAQTGNLYTLPYTYVSLGQAYQFLKDYETAKNYLKLSEEAVEKLGGTENIVKTYKATSSIYYNMGMYEQAEYAAQKALKLAENHGLIYEKKQLTYILSRLYYDIRKYANAHQYLSKYKIVSDTLNSLERGKINSQDLFKKYEIAEKERTLTEKELDLTKQINTTQVWVLATLAALILMISLLFLIFYNRIRYEKQLNDSFELIMQNVKSLRQQIDTGKPILSEPHQKNKSDKLTHTVEQIVLFEQEMLAKLKTSTSFNYLVSHELLRDLNQIKDTLLLFNEETDTFTKSALNNCINRVSELNYLVKELLELSELQQKPLYNSIFTLSDLINEVKEELNIPKGYELQASNLPTIRADVLLMKQVFINLLKNAIKYSSNQANTTIHIIAELGEEMQIKIMHQGSGSYFNSNETLLQSFQLSYNDIGSISKKNTELVIVSEIVRKHKGRVFAYNNVGGETTFGFSLPNSCLI